MGCHTWAYRMVRLDEFDKVKSFVTNYLKASPTLVPEGVTEEEHIDKIFKDYTRDHKEKVTKDEIANIVRKGNKRVQTNLKKLEKCIDLKSLAKIYKSAVEDCEYTVVNGDLYVSCGFDDPCRIYGYPTESFTDVEEFINWIKEQESIKDHLISERYEQEEKKYYTGCDKTMEEKIRAFWKKYDDKVYVRFG